MAVLQDLARGKGMGLGGLDARAWIEVLSAFVVSDLVLVLLSTRRTLGRADIGLDSTADTAAPGLRLTTVVLMVAFLLTFAAEILVANGILMSVMVRLILGLVAFVGGASAIAIGASHWPIKLPEQGVASKQPSGNNRLDNRS